MSTRTQMTALQRLRTTGVAAALIYMGWIGFAKAAEAPAAPVLDSSRVAEMGTSGRLLSTPLGVAIDMHAAEVVVANTGANRVEFFDFLGRPRGSFIHQVMSAAGEMIDGQPKHVGVDAQGRVIVADAMSPDLWVRDFRGQLIERVKLPAPDDRLETGGAGPFVIAADGRIFVASRAREARIHVLDAEFHPVATWGTPGTKPGQLKSISSVALMGDSALVVTCVSTELGVQIFGLDGRYRRGFGIHEIGDGNFSQPTGVTVGADGRIWVVDAVRKNMQVFDPAGTLIGVLGGGEGPGSWLYPSALASDGRGLFALAESGGNRLRLLWIRQAMP